MLAVYAIEKGEEMGLFGLLLLFSFADFGIKKMQGDIYYCPEVIAGAKPEVKKVQVADVIKEGMCLVSEKGHLILVKAPQIIVAKGPFHLKVSIKSPYLQYGKVRFQLKNVKDFRLQTRNAVVGVRGTDFFASYNEDLGETEVICFESSISLSDLDDTNKKVIPAGYWGGKGGRFGLKITEPMQLTTSFINNMKSDVEL